MGQAAACGAGVPSGCVACHTSARPLTCVGLPAAGQAQARPDQEVEQVVVAAGPRTDRTTVHAGGPRTAAGRAWGRSGRRRGGWLAHRWVRHSWVPSHAVYIYVSTCGVRACLRVAGHCSHWLTCACAWRVVHAPEGTLRLCRPGLCTQRNRVRQDGSREGRQLRAAMPCTLLAACVVHRAGHTRRSAHMYVANARVRPASARFVYNGRAHTTRYSCMIGCVCVSSVALHGARLGPLCVCAMTSLQAPLLDCVVA